MSYQVHNFQTGDIIAAAPANEMDAQIQKNEQDIAQKVDSSAKGAANGIASLDENGKVPTDQMPGSIMSTVEYNSRSDFPATGETGVMYYAKDTSKTYLWGGTEYIDISSPLVLGETSSTAHRGDHGKAAYDHANDQNKTSTAKSSGMYKIGITSEGHISSATAIEKSDITGLGIPAQDTTYESKEAASGGTDVSLVTTGEKYTWNSKPSTIKQDGITGATVKRMGTCSTPAGTQEKVVTGISGAVTIENGTRISVFFSYQNTAQNPYLTISTASPGYIPIFANGHMLTGNEVGMLNGVCDFVYSNMRWYLTDHYVNTFPCAYTKTTSYKDGTVWYINTDFPDYIQRQYNYFQMIVTLTLNGDDTTGYVLNVAGRGGNKDLIIDNNPTGTNVPIPQGIYIVYYDGTAYHLRTDGSIPGSIAEVNGHTVDSDVPQDAVFTDTTYESLTAVQDGQDVSLVTNGEKYEWNQKAPKASPVFTNSISLNRDPYSETGNNSVACGLIVEASGEYSHGEGNQTNAIGGSSHAEGYMTNSTGSYSHAEGSSTTSSGHTSHSEGGHTISAGDYSHAEGYYTYANSDYQHTAGKFNVSDNNNVYAEIVGNGELNDRSNARALDWEGNEHLAGDLYMYCNNDSTEGTSVTSALNALTPPVSSGDEKVPITVVDDAMEGMPVQCDIEITPAQDMNGYDYPWPDGGNKNLFDQTAVTTGVRLSDQGAEVEDADYYASDYIPVTVGTTYVKNSPTADGYHRFVAYDSSKEFIRAANDSDQTITIASGEAYIRMCGLQTELNTTQVEAGSTSTSYVPYINICPVNGTTFDDAVITRRGKNMINQDNNENGYTLGPNGQLIEFSSWCVTDFIKLDSTRKWVDRYHYAFSTEEDASCVVCLYDIDKQFVSYMTPTSSSPLSKRPTVTFYISENSTAKYARIAYRLICTNPQLEPAVEYTTQSGTTTTYNQLSTEYQPYRLNTYSVENPVCESSTETMTYNITTGRQVSAGATATAQFVSRWTSEKQTTIIGTKTFSGFNGLTVVSSTSGSYNESTKKTSITVTVRNNTSSTRTLPSSATVRAQTEYYTHATIYNGSMSIGERGTGYVDAITNKLPLNLLTWEYDTTNNRFKGSGSNIKNTTARTMNILCNMYRTVSDGTEIANVPDFCIYNEGEYVCIHDSRFTNATLFEAALTGGYFIYEHNGTMAHADGSTIVIDEDDNGHYEIDTPIIRSLDGTNVVFADIGNNSIMYHKNALALAKYGVKECAPGLTTLDDSKEGGVFTVGYDDDKDQLKVNVPYKNFVLPATDCGIGDAVYTPQSYTNQPKVHHLYNTGLISAEAGPKIGTIKLTKKSVSVNSSGVETIMTLNPIVYVLPQVTAEDNGKILKVVDGAWALVTP